jgi:hypothetical protein
MEYVCRELKNLREVPFEEKASEVSQWSRCGIGLLIRFQCVEYAETISNCSLCQPFLAIKAHSHQRGSRGKRSGWAHPTDRKWDISDTEDSNEVILPQLYSLNISLPNHFGAPSHLLSIHERLVLVGHATIIIIARLWDVTPASAASSQRECYFTCPFCSASMTSSDAPSRERM